MKSITLACFTLLVAGAYTSSIQSTNQNGLDFGDFDDGDCGRGHVDWCEDLSHDECLCNKINIQGPLIELVNLDDHCQLERIRDEGGIFLLSGDLLVIAGQNNVSASQAWSVSNFDTGVVGTGDNFELVTNDTNGISI